MAPSKLKSIALDLEAAMRNAGVSERELAEATGIARTTLRRKIRRPGTFTLDEFAEVTAYLKVDVKSLEVAS